MKKLTILILALTGALTARADEGLWLPYQIESQVKDMRSKGFRLSADDLYSVNKPSLSDAVVLFGGGCTGAIVSSEGLLLTNHHCGFDHIADHSTLEHDYLKNGFWAMSQSEELPNPDLEVRILVRMENVTDAVDAGQRQVILERATENGRYRADIKPLYYGNEHWLWVYEVFTDVRLVAAPPSAIGKFGGDTDNWMWPRHTGDFSVFRIYADRNNRPANFSPDNVPYRPKKFFTISTEGLQEGDFTFVYGFPGTTRQYVTSDEVKYVVERSNPMKIHVRTQRLAGIKALMDNSTAERIALASLQSSIANGWKKWQGESWGLQRRRTIARKQIYEERFRHWAASRPEYARLLDSLATAYSHASDRLFWGELQNESTGLVRFPGTFNYVPDVVRWYTPYMKALREFDPDRRFYPDANLTLRISYGAIAGYHDENDIWHTPFTDLDGVMAKDNPDIYDYDIPTRLRELFAEQDYGRWAIATSCGHKTVPVCFLASNHTAGGNSGSPVLNGHGQIIGLNFDRTWLSTMSDLEFDGEFCRNISVDIRYVMFVIEKVGGAGWLTREMTFSRSRN